MSILVIASVVHARRPARHLRRRGAISPETALASTDLSSSDQRRLPRLVQQGIVREAAPGTYYYDAAGERARFRKKLPILLTIVVVVAAVGAGLGYWIVSHPSAPR